MNTLKNIKPLLMFVSILSFVVSLVFTVQLLSSQASTGADKALFGGLAISSEFGKVILFSIGMMLLFVVKNRRYSWIGVPLLIISLSFTILSVIGTLGALYTKNAEKTEASVLSSDKYQTLKSQISTYDQQIAQLQASANGLPANYYTKKQQLLNQASDLAKQKEKAVQTLQNFQTTGTGAQNALYVALADWSGDSVENAKFKVMASYGIGLEALALFCALFAFFGDYMLRNRNEQTQVTGISRYEPEEVEFEEDYNYNALTAENERLREELEFYQRERLEARKRNEFQDVEYDEEDEEEEELMEMPERNVGFTAEFEPGRKKLPSIRDYINVAFQNIEENGKEHLTGRSKIAKKLQIGKGKANRFHKYLKQMNLVEVEGSKTYPLVSKTEMIRRCRHEC